MKHLLNGVAIAAALAIAAPAWAQAPMTPTAKTAPKAAAPAPATPAAGAPAAPMASKQRHKRGSHRMARRGRGGAPTMTDQLNREELARIQGGAPPMPPQGIAGQPNELRGIPGAGQPSASEHPGMPR
jgi:hypothetical protein